MTTSIFKKASTNEIMLVTMDAMNKNYRLFKFLLEDLAWSGWGGPDGPGVPGGLNMIRDDYQVYRGKIREHHQLCEVELAWSQKNDTSYFDANPIIRQREIKCFFDAINKNKVLLHFAHQCERIILEKKFCGQELPTCSTLKVFMECPELLSNLTSYWLTLDVLCKIIRTHYGLHCDRECSRIHFLLNEEARMMYMPESVTPVQPDQANQVERTTVSSRTPVEQHRPAPVAVELSCAPASVVSPTKGPYDGLCPVRVDDTSRSTREPHHTTAAVELSCAPAADLSTRSTTEPHQPPAVELLCAPAADLSTRSTTAPHQPPAVELSCAPAADLSTRSTTEPHQPPAVELLCAPAADLSTRSTTEPHQPPAVELSCAPAADLSTRSTTEPHQPPAVELSCAPDTSRYTTKGPYDGICPVRVDDSSTEPRYAPVPADLSIRMVAPPFIKHPYDFFKDRKYVIDLSDDDNDISDCEENNDHEVMDALTARTRWRNEQNMMADIYKDRLVEWWDAKMKAKPTVDMEKTKYRNRNREYMSPLSVVRNYLAGEDRKAAERNARLSTTTAVPLPTTTAERLPTTGIAGQLRPSTALMSQSAQPKCPQNGLSTQNPRLPQTDLLSKMPELAQNGVQSNRPNYPPNVDMMSKKPKLAQNGVQSNRPKCPPTDLLSEMLKMAQNGVKSNGSKCPPTDLLSEMLKLAQNGVQSNRPNYPPNVDMLSKKPKLAQNGVQSNRPKCPPNIDMMSKKPKLPQNGLSSTNKPNCPTKTDLAQKDDYDKMLELVEQQSRGNSGREVMKPVTAVVQGSSSVSAILQKRKRDDTAPDDMPRPLKYAKSSQPDPTPSVRPKALVRPSEPSRPCQSTKSSARDKIKCAWNIAAILGSGDSRDHVSKSKKQKRM